MVTLFILSKKISFYGNPKKNGFTDIRVFYHTAWIPHQTNC